MVRARDLFVAALLAVACFGGPKVVSAQTDGPLSDFFTDVIENHDRVLASQAGVDAAYQRSLESLGAWYPTLDISASVERYRLDRSLQDTIISPAQELTGTVTQMLWDFGSTNAGIERARLQHVQSEIALVQVRQNLIAEALAAYISLIQSAEVVIFAQRSEDNIRRQTGLEEARIEAGSGVTTDLLQAKTQLAGAQARRVDAEGAFELALNRYRAVFGAIPPDLDALPGVSIQREALPDSLDSAISEAFIGNPDIRLASIDISLAEQDRIAATADSFAPTFEIVGERTMTKNDGGTIGRRLETSMKLQLSFPFNLGFTALNTLRASQSDFVSVSRTMADLERSTEERVRNAWKSLETAEARAGYLFDQAGIARAFLEVAIQERQLGQRSLIDVLAGETSLINAQSDAIAAEAEVLLAVVELYAASGALTYDVIETVARPDRAEMLAPIPGLAGVSGPDPAMQLLDPTQDLGSEIDPATLFNSPPDLLVPSPSSEPVAPPPEPPVSAVEPEPQSDAQPEPIPDPQPAADQAPTPDPASLAAPEVPAATANPPPEDPAANNFLQNLEQAPSFDSDPVPVPPAANPAQAPGAGDDTDLDNPLFDWAQ